MRKRKGSDVLVTAAFMAAASELTKANPDLVVTVTRAKDRPREMAPKPRRRRLSKRQRRATPKKVNNANS